MSFEAYNPEATENFYNNNVGDAFLMDLEGSGPMDRMSVSELLDKNEQTVMETAANMVKHFSNVLSNLPEEMQRELIESLPTPGKHDVVYAGMIDTFNKSA